MTWRDDDDELKALLQRAVPPERDTEPARDLWPAMARRLDETRAGVPWFDWMLAAAAILCLLLFPEAMFSVLYHF